MHQEDTLNVKQIEFNQLLLDAHSQFQQRDMANAIQTYEIALNSQEAGRDTDRMAIILANLGIIYFHNCDYKQATEKLTQALQMMSEGKNDFKSALMIKIFGNLAIIKLITTDFQECKDYNDQAIQLIYSKQPPLQYQLFKELMYIYYRFQSFESMGDGNFENLEQKYDGQSLACFYSSMGLNRELCGDLNLALKYHQKALKLWQEAKENGFIVITLRRLITIIQNQRQDPKDYVIQLQKSMQSQELKGISPEILFKDCEKKLQCAREITASLQKVEQNLNYQKNSQLLSQPLLADKQQDGFWKLALKLRLRRAQQYCYAQMEKSQVAENTKILQQSVAQLDHSLKLLESQQPYENYLQNLPFTKDSVNIVKSSMQKLNLSITRFFKLQFFMRLQEIVQEYNQHQSYEQQNYYSQSSQQLQNQNFKQQNPLNQQLQPNQQIQQLSARQRQQDQMIPQNQTGNYQMGSAVLNTQYNQFNSQPQNYKQENQILQGNSQVEQNQYQEIQYENSIKQSQAVSNNQFNQFEIQRNAQQQGNFASNNSVKQGMKSSQQQLTLSQQQFQSQQQQQFQTQQQQQQLFQQQQLAQQQQNQKVQQSQIIQSQVKSNINMTVSVQKSKKLKNSKLLDGAYKTVMMGDYLTKCNKSSNGRLERFFLLATDGTFRWAQKEKQINDPKSVISYDVSDIRGIYYGKVTDVLRKSSNEELRPWLCFSLIMKTRSMDFVVQQHQINPWVIALSEEIKRRNQYAFVITPGRFLWRKVYFILHWYFVDLRKKKDKKDKDDKKKKKKLPRNTFVHVLHLYKLNQCKLP